jgi:WD40 repeat protein
LIDQSNHLHIWDVAGSPADPALRASESNPNRISLDGLTNLALRPDGALLAIGDRAGVVTLIDTVRHSIVGSIRSFNDEAASMMLALTFSPDGRTLAVGSQQGAIALYSVHPPTRPRLRLKLPGHHGLVTHVVFDASGTRLASVSLADPPLVEVWELELIARDLAGLGLAEESL